MAVEDSNTKRCSKCGEIKSREAFSRDADKRDGLSTRCKPCRSAENAEWRAKNQDKTKALNAEWRSKNIEYSAKYRAANVDRQRMYDARRIKENPDRERERFAKYRAENPEKVRETLARYRDANREKLRERGEKYRLNNLDKRRIYSHNRRARVRANEGKLSTGLSAKLFKLQRGKCACCGKPLGSNYHLDHIMPIALGGKNEDSNIQLLRNTCNQQKHAKHPVEFMQQRGFLL